MRGEVDRPRYELRFACLLVRVRWLASADESLGQQIDVYNLSECGW
jgi:hypothetical protein